MDVISHGLWGGIAFGRKNPKNYLVAFLIGVGPDVFSFGIFWIARWLGVAEEINFSGGHPDQSLIPQYVHTLYDITHSLVIFFAVFFLVWFLIKKPYRILGAWFLHIIIDIPTHSSSFFPTPFLWPVSNFKVDGISWGNPMIFFPDVAILLILYAVFFYRKMKERRKMKNNL